MLQGPTSTLIGTNATSAAVAQMRARASEVIKASFSTNKDRPSINDLLDALGLFETSFLEFKNIADPLAEDIVAQILLKIEFFPLDIQEHIRQFTSRSGQQSSLINIINEGKMFDELKNLVAEHPQKPILHWPELVDRITSLVENNPKYTAFVTKVRGHRNTNGGWLKRKAIGVSFLGFLSLLPEDLKKAGISGFDRALVRAGL